MCTVAWLLGRSASESGRLCRGAGARDAAIAAKGCPEGANVAFYEAAGRVNFSCPCLPCSCRCSLLTRRVRSREVLSAVYSRSSRTSGGARRRTSGPAGPRALGGRAAARPPAPSAFCGVDREVLLWGVMPPRQARGQPLHPIYALSRQAAEDLGFTKSGKAKVKLEVEK